MWASIVCCREKGRRGGKEENQQFHRGEADSLDNLQQKENNAERGNRGGKEMKALHIHPRILNWGWGGGATPISGKGTGEKTRSVESSGRTAAQFSTTMKENGHKGVFRDKEGRADWRAEGEGDLFLLNHLPLGYLKRREGVRSLLLGNKEVDRTSFCQGETRGARKKGGVEALHIFGECSLPAFIWAKGSQFLVSILRKRNKPKPGGKGGRRLYKPGVTQRRKHNVGNFGRGNVVMAVPEGRYEGTRESRQYLLRLGKCERWA